MELNGPSGKCVATIANVIALICVPFAACFLILALAYLEKLLFWRRAWRESKQKKWSKGELEDHI